MRSGGLRRSRIAAKSGKRGLSHVDPRGRVTMVDVGDKPITHREAIARGLITMSRRALTAIRRRAVAKGRPAPGRTACRHHGRQADVDADSTVSSPSTDARQRGAGSDAQGGTGLRLEFERARKPASRWRRWLRWPLRP